MISKDLDPFIEGDAQAHAGRKAEENLAHYLRRAFANTPEFLILIACVLNAIPKRAEMWHK